MKTFYVSLVKDLLGCYLQYEAKDEITLREYLRREYLTSGYVWKLPWCSVYETIPDLPGIPVTIIKAPCGPIRY